MYDNQHTILVVDDVKDNRTIVQTILEDVGYDVVCAPDGMSALNLVGECDFDLILLDIMMPDMTGIEVCRFLKIDPETASIPVIFLTASTQRELLTRAYKVGGSDYIKKPFYREELLARVQTRLKLRDYEKNLEATVRQRTQEIHETQVEMMYVLGSIAEGHSRETHHHVQRVSEFAYLLAVRYGMPQKEAELLKDAAALHDIGKLAIPEAILHKEGKLNRAETKKIQEHPVLGANMLKHSQLPLFKAASIVSQEHHEKYDGSGYPYGLRGKDIHIYGRIVAIADVFDALLFKRSYKNRWEVSEVITYMKEMKGKHFDPSLIDIFVENIEEFLAIYDIYLRKIELEPLKTSKNNSSLLKRFFGF